MSYLRKRRKKRHCVVHIRKREETVRADVTNKARVGTVSGILNITVQVPIQIGANAQNLCGSDGTSTTVI